MSFTTLVAIFAVLSIFGNGPTRQAHADTGATCAPAQCARTVEDTPTPPQGAETGGPQIIPIRYETPSPDALRPSPEYRTTSRSAAGQDIRTVTANRLNVRSGPSAAEAVLDRLSRGDEVLVTSEPTGDWVQIRIEGDGIEGWVARDHLRPAL